MTRAVLQVCETSGAFISWWGFKGIQGRVWTFLALRRDPTSQAEVSRTLGVSKALVSTTVAELCDYGLVRRVDRARLSPYEAVFEVWPVISNVLRGREWMLLESSRVALEAAIQEVEIQEESGHPMPYDLGRMKLLLGLTEMAQAFLKVILALRVPRTVESMGGWLGKAARLTGVLRKLR